MTIIIIIIIIIIITIVITIIIIIVLEVWQISSDVKNERNGGNHEVDENNDNTFIIYIFAYLYSFIY